MISHQIKPWRRNQSGQFPQKIHRIKDHIGRSISPTMPQLIQNTAVRELRQTLRRHRRPPRVPAEFETPQSIPFPDLIILGEESHTSGKERDAETGLDYFGARYLSSAQGRWTSPDPTYLSVNAFNPQSWNRYSYVLNNPLLYVDPMGLWELYAEDLYKIKKKKDGTEERVFDKRVIYARQTQDNDDGASLAKQLGLTGKDAAKFAEKVGSGDNVHLADQGGLIGSVFGAVETRLTDRNVSMILRHL